MQRYFSKVAHGYRIRRTIREMCTFARQDLAQDPPFSRIDLVSCRNLLIYFGSGLQHRCLPIFHYALNPGGHLILGPAETVGSMTNLFALVDRKNKIYLRSGAAGPHPLEFSAPIPPMKLKPAKTNSLPALASLRDRSLDIQRQVERILLHHYSPAGVVIDAQMQVLQFRGKTGPFLEHPQGGASLNLLRIVRQSLTIDLRTLLHKAAKQNGAALQPGALLETEQGVREIDLEVIPFKTPPENEPCYLVLFKERPHRADEPAFNQKANGKKRNLEAERLRRELDSNKESLQAIIEEQEATNEELKSANEEIESSNEELQSTNEELGTAKEDLQSTNEELQTLNEELNNRNGEMAQINNDLTNLLSSVNIPIVMVDNSLSVRRVTPLAARYFNLIPTDLGRNFGDIKPNLRLDNLEEILCSVIKTLVPYEGEVEDSDQRWHLLRIRPYRTRENSIDGAVITLLDIDELKKSLAKAENISRHIEAIVNTVGEALLVLDGGLRVIKASRSFYQTFGLQPAEVEQKKFYEIDEARWGAEALRQLLEEVLPRQKKFDDYEFTTHGAGRQPQKMRINGHRLENDDEPLILLALEAITARPPAAPQRPARRPARGPRFSPP